MKDSLLTLVVTLLGMGSTACGLIAEATRPKRDDISLQNGEYVYPMSPAFVLGLVAVALLLLAVASATSCCRCCCGHRDGVSATSFGLGILFAVLSWLMALYAALFFLLAVAANQPGMRGKAPECYDYVHADNLFPAAAMKALFATVLGLLSDKMLRAGPSHTVPA